MSRRRDISFKHHAEAASLNADDCERILTEAEQKGLPASWVREQVRLLNGTSDDEQEVEQSDEADEEKQDDITAKILSKPNRLQQILKIIASLEPHELDLLRERLADI